MLAAGSPLVKLRDRSVAIDARYLKRRGVGISKVVHELIIDTVATGASVTLLTDDREHASSLAEEYPQALSLSLPAKSGMVWEQLHLARYLRSWHPDLFVSPANVGLPLFGVARTRAVLVVHDLIPIILPRQYLLERPAWALKYLVSLAISLLRVDACIAASDSTVRSLRNVGCKVRIEVVYPPLPDEPQDGRVSIARDPIETEIAGSGPASGGDESHRYILYNGGADLRKNMPGMVRSFARLRQKAAFADIRLVLLGSGVEWIAPLIVELGIESVTEMPGYVTEEDKWQLVRQAAAVVYPSRFEGFGLVVAEALAVGTPIVTGTGGSLVEVGGGAAIYVDPTDDMSIVTGIEMAMDPAARSRLRSAAAAQTEILVLRASKQSYAGALAGFIS